MITDFRDITLHPSLTEYVKRIFVIRSSGRFPNSDMKLIVPNGCPKLVFTLDNGLIATSAEQTHISRPKSITFIGMGDIPAIVDIMEEGPAANITVEFSPLGAYRFIGGCWSEYKNRVCDFGEIDQCTSRTLKASIEESNTLTEKLQIVQAFLLEQFAGRQADVIYEFCCKEIIKSNGTVAVTQLSRQTGYSERWLRKKFLLHAGIGPKNLASLVRFQTYYSALVAGRDKFFLERDFYLYFKDQSHFTKDFKRFTGHPPLLFARSENDYDRFFYKG